MNVAVICDLSEQERGQAVVDALEARGAQASLFDPGAPEEPGPTAELAHNLVEIESHLAASPAEAVALIGHGDRPFAGVLVATKARVPAFRLNGSAIRGDEIDNAALIARLADHEVDGDADAVAESITRELGAS